MPPVSEQDVQFCARVCKVAKAQKIAIKEHDTALGHSFTWQLANGQPLAGPICLSRESALLSACKTLLPIIFNYV